MKLFQIVCLLLLFFSLAFSQQWGSDINLNINSTSIYDDRIDLFTNQDGHHVIMHKDNSLTYYLFNESGSQVRSVSIDNYAETYHLSRVTGYENNVYVIYKKNGYINAKRTTDSGQNWTNITPQELTYSTSNGLEVVSDANGVHIAWSELYGTNYYETNYSRLDHFDTYWSDFKQVTDYGYHEGGIPTIATVDNRIFVGYYDNTDYSDPHIYPFSYNPYYREKNQNGWQTPDGSMNLPTFYGKLSIANGILYNLNYWAGDISLPDYTYSYVISLVSKDIDNTWYENMNQFGSTGCGGFYPSEHNRGDIATTENDIAHIMYSESGETKYITIEDNVSSTPIDYSFNKHFRIKKDGNDIYLIWVNYTSTYLKKRDYAPTKPKELDFGDLVNLHPQINWAENKEMDFDHYEIWKKRGTGNWFLKTTTTSTEYVDASEIAGGQAREKTMVYYKLKAVDNANNKSDYCSEISRSVKDFGGIGLPLAKKSGFTQFADVGSINNFELKQNYPNPFNPITNIPFSIAKEGHVNISVYNIEGKEVAVLVDNHLSNGSYAVTFNADQLPSGIYIYKIQAPGFTASKKMFFVK